MMARLAMPSLLVAQPGHPVKGCFSKMAQEGRSGTVEAHAAAVDGDRHAFRTQSCCTRTAERKAVDTHDYFKFDDG